MSSLAEQLNAKKEKLHHSKTKVTSADGKSWIEDSHCNKIENISTNNPGFVVDTKPDLRLTQILDRLIIGSQDVAHDLDLLNKHKITHILNVASGVVNLFEGWFTYKTKEALDIPEYSILEIFDECCDFIYKTIKTGGCILVHCNAGVSRSASIIIAYLIKYYDMTFDEAFRFVKGKRSFIRPNEGFVEQLKTYEKKLNK